MPFVRNVLITGDRVKLILKSVLMSERCHRNRVLFLEKENEGEGSGSEE